MIVENKSQRDYKLNELKQNLNTQGYPLTIINNGFEKAKNANQKDLRIPKDKTNEDIIAFTITFNPNNPNVFNFVKSSIENINMNKTEGNIFKKSKIINSRRQPPSLERLLCKSDCIRPEKMR